MLEAETRKIAPHHLEREACLYVRQSSLRQVVQNTESTRRQYGLSQRATALGWPAERIRVIDEDQGKSGAYSGNRSGFRDLMGSIAAGEVGIVLGLEVSSLPIRLTPMTATYRVPPLSRVKLGIGWSRGVARDAEQ